MGPLLSSSFRRGVKDPWLVLIFNLKNTCKVCQVHQLFRARLADKRRRRGTNTRSYGDPIRALLISTRLDFDFPTPPYPTYLALD